MIWSGNHIWKNIFIDIEDGMSGARYKIKNDYDSICDAINESYIHSLAGDTLVVKNIGTIKIENFSFDNKANQITIKSTLLSSYGR